MCLKTHGLGPWCFLVGKCLNQWALMGAQRLFAREADAIGNEKMAPQPSATGMTGVAGFGYD